MPAWSHDILNIQLVSHFYTFNQIKKYCTAKILFLVLYTKLCSQTLNYYSLSAWIFFLAFKQFIVKIYSTTYFTISLISVSLTEYTYQVFYTVHHSWFINIWHLREHIQASNITQSCSVLDQYLVCAMETSEAVYRMVQYHNSLWNVNETEISSIPR